MRVSFFKKKLIYGYLISVGNGEEGTDNAGTIVKFRKQESKSHFYSVSTMGMFHDVMVLYQSGQVCTDGCLLKEGLWIKTYIHISKR